MKRRVDVRISAACFSVWRRSCNQNDARLSDIEADIEGIRSLFHTSLVNLDAFDEFFVLTVVKDNVDSLGSKFRILLAKDRVVDVIGDRLVSGGNDFFVFFRSATDSVFERLRYG